MKTLNVKINFLNVYHLCNKVEDIKVQLYKSQKTIHMLGLSETRLDERIDDNLISIQNYTLIRRDKAYSMHTGLAVYIHNSISSFVKRRLDLENTEIECIWLEYKQNKSTPLLICFIYRNPKETANWLDNFETMIDNVQKYGFDIIVEGDFNIDLNKPQPIWNNLTLSLGISQLVTESTRVKDKSQTLIDHIYSTNKSKTTNVKVSKNNFKTNDTSKVNDIGVTKNSVSDHFMISCNYTQKIKLENKKGHTHVQYRCYKRLNSSAFLQDLLKLPLGNVYHTTDPDIALQTLLEMILPIIDKHIPLRMRRVKHPNLPTWLNESIIKAMEVRDQHKINKNIPEFKKQRNKVSSMIIEAKREYFNKLINDQKDTASIWRAMNEFSKAKKGTKSQPINLCPNDINNFFLNISETLLEKSTIESSTNYECPKLLINFCKDKTQNSTFKIPYLSISEVEKLIFNLKDSNALGPDNISVKILKLMAPCLIEYLTYIYNLCIDKNIFPGQLKDAKIIPIPKTKDASHPQHLRPISLLPVLSKPLEKHIHKHMYDYLNALDLLHQYQSGFRPLHSCHTALVHLCDNWLTAINDNKLVGTVFLDFKKAFDLVNHKTLLLKLREYFPKSQLNELMTSYLAERHQYVYLNGKTSEKRIIKSGVPQGSILGPLLFLIYINDLSLHLKIHPLHPNEKTNIELFADDATIYTINKDIDILNKSLQSSLDLAVSWCNINSMVIHPEKTSSMIITTRQKNQLNKPKLTLYIGKKLIEQVQTQKTLGICIDSELNWKNHINNLAKRLSKNVFLLSKLKKYVDTKSLSLFFDAHIMSHLNYSSTIWDGCCKDTFKKINRIHRRAIKVMSPLKNISTDLKMKCLKVLPLSEHLKYNKAIFLHKIYHKKTPSYLEQLLKKAPDRYGSLNVLPTLPRIDLFKTSLSYSGSVIWNSLSPDLKKNMSTCSFKQHLYDKLLKQCD